MATLEGRPAQISQDLPGSVRASDEVSPEEASPLGAAAMSPLGGVMTPANWLIPLAAVAVLVVGYLFVVYEP